MLSIIMHLYTDTSVMILYKLLNLQFVESWHGELAI